MDTYTTKVGDLPGTHGEEVVHTVERPSGVASSGDFLPDPMQIWLAFRRHLRLFAAVVAICLAAVAAWTLTRTPLYAARSSVLIQPKQDTVINVRSVSPDLGTDSDTIDTEVRMLRSPTLAQRAAEAYSRRYPSPDGSAWTEPARAALAARMASSVRVARDGLTLVIDITARSPEPLFAMRTVNLLAENYVQSQQDVKVGATKGANEWLNVRVDQLRAAAIASETALQQYKVRNGLMSANGATMAEQEVSALNQQIAQARAEAAEKRGRLNAARAQLSRGGGGADVGAAIGSGTIGSLRQREAQASAEVARLRGRYGPLHPDLQRALRERVDIEEQIQREINRVLSSLEAEARVADSRLASLSGSQSNATQVLATNNGAQVGLSELQNRADAAKAIYETFLNRSRETSAQEGLQQADARVASLAILPTSPYSPNYRLAIMFGLLGSLAAGMIAVGLSEYLQRGVRTKRDVERKLRVRYAGAVPTLKSTLGKLRQIEPPHDYVVSHPLSLFAEAFRSIRAFLVLKGGGRPRVLAITSALPQEGKTTTSVCLARTSAMEGLHTVLVDCDLRRRGASSLIGHRRDGDLYDYLAGRSTLDEVVTIDEATGLHMLATAESQVDAHDPLTSANMQRMLTELRARYEVIILDTAPILGVADARTIAASADRVLLITRWKSTSVGAVEAAIDILIDAGAKLSGLALTQVDITRYASTGDGDLYGYQKKFKGYYTN